MSLHARDARRYPIVTLCALFGRSKQAYFKYDHSSFVYKVRVSELVFDFVREARSQDPGIGCLKLWHMYQQSLGTAHPLGRDRFLGILDRYGLKLRMKRCRVRTTDSTHGLRVYPNLIRDFVPTSANQLWVSDITYIRILLEGPFYGYCYLSMIMDSYSEEIVGWSVGNTLESSYPVLALRMALSRIEGLSCVSLIHHSDRGKQYASSDYVSLLQSHNIRISMTEHGDPKENAQAERINGTIKNELLKGMEFHSIEEVRIALRDAISFYNTRRPHMSINMLTPSEASGCVGELPKKWHSYRLLALKRAQADSLNSEKGLPLLSEPEISPKNNAETTSDRNKTLKTSNKKSEVN